MKRASSNTKLSSNSSNTPGSSPVHPLRSLFRKGSVGPTEISPVFVQPHVNAQSTVSAFGLFKMKYAKSREKMSANSGSTKSPTSQNKISDQPKSLLIKVSGSQLEQLAAVSSAPVKYLAKSSELGSKKLDVKETQTGPVYEEAKSPHDCISSPETESPVASGSSPNKFRVFDGSLINTPFARAISPNLSLVSKAASGNIQYRSRTLRSSSQADNVKKQTLARQSSGTTISTGAVRSTRSRLQEFLGEFDSAFHSSPKPSEQKPAPITEAIPAVLETPDPPTMVTIAAPQPVLKDMLLDPEQVGKELTVSQFRRLESNTNNQTLKSCLKPSDLHRQTSLFEQNLEATKPTLKRAVSFSENVVMFIYQA